MIDLWVTYWKLWEIALGAEPAPRRSADILPFRKRKAKR